MTEFTFKLEEGYLEKLYTKYKNPLKGATKGEVVTCFALDFSEYLNIGHAKMAMIAYHYACIYQGKMIVRFENTDPLRSREYYTNQILDDLQSLNIKYDKIIYTSDYFDDLLNIMTYLIKQGRCYCDNTSREIMMENRKRKISSPCRDQTPKQNLDIWEQMIKGQCLDYCVRGKEDMKEKNFFLEDPVLFRHSQSSHYKTGTKYKVYPTYDFASPIVDCLQGVTHRIRPTKDLESIELYNWILGICHLLPVTICQFTRLELTRTSISKKKMYQLTHNGDVEGWDDPRLPNVRSVLRRGVQVPTLVEFMLEQAMCRTNHAENWDKLFSCNVKYIEPIAGRYSAILKKKISTIVLIDVPFPSELEMSNVPLHPNNAALGTKTQYQCNEMYLDYEDAITLKIGEKFTLMKLSNAIVVRIEEQDQSLLLKAKLLKEDKDFKSTKKINWLPKCSFLQSVTLVKYDDLFAVDEIYLGTPVNPQSKITIEAFADPSVRNLQKGSVVQFERRGYFIVDHVAIQGDEKHSKLIYIPNGKTRKGIGFTV